MTGWKGTPGPWSLLGGKSKRPGEQFYTLAKSGERGVERHIAEMSWGTNNPQGEADAQGCKAVPQLVEALVKIARPGCGCAAGVTGACECHREPALRIYREEAIETALEALKAAGVEL